MTTKYKDFAPTPFDCKGLALPDRQEWIVAPVCQTRDSRSLAQSIFEAAQRILDADKAEYEVHRFDHWRPGWFEIILVHPDHEASVKSMECALADYPVLDDEDFSEREYNEAKETWDSWGFKDFIAAIQDRFELSDLAKDILLKGDKDKAWNTHMQNSNEPYYDGGDGMYFNFGWIEDVTRTQIANTIRAIRKRG